MAAALILKDTEQYTQEGQSFHRSNIVFRVKIDYDRCMTESYKGACTS